MTRKRANRADIKKWRGRGDIAWIIARVAPNEQMMVSAQKGIRYKRRRGGTVLSLAVATILPFYSFPPPSFLYPLYTDVPLNATYGSPFRKVASRIFVGWAVSLHVVDNGLPFRPRSRPAVPDRSSFSFPPSSGSLDLRERVVRRWRGGLRSPLEGGGTGMCGAHSGRKI